MPARTTDDAVKAIIATELDTTPFIYTAHLLTDMYCGDAALSEDILTEIETYWAAHLVSIREPRPHQVKTGETTVTYVEGDLGAGLQSTFYGQVVIELSNGALAAAAEGTVLKNASFYLD
jgi:hypothetical protein